MSNSSSQCLWNRSFPPLSLERVDFSLPLATCWRSRLSDRRVYSLASANVYHVWDLRFSVIFIPLITVTLYGDQARISYPASTIGYGRPVMSSQEFSLYDDIWRLLHDEVAKGGCIFQSDCVVGLTGCRYLLASDHRTCISLPAIKGVKAPVDGVRNTLLPYALHSKAIRGVHPS